MPYRSRSTEENPKVSDRVNIPIPLFLNRNVSCLTLRPIFTFNQISLKIVPLWGGSSRAARFARGAAALRQRARQRPPLWGGSSRAARFARGAAALRQRARQRLAKRVCVSVCLNCISCTQSVNLSQYWPLKFELIIGDNRCCPCQASKTAFRSHCARPDRTLHTSEAFCPNFQFLPHARLTGLTSVVRASMIHCIC